MIPRPSCPFGYTDSDLKTLLGVFYPKFMKWMAGQTVTVCDGQIYDHETKVYTPTGCKDHPHGSVTYPWDLERWLQNLPVVD